MSCQITSPEHHNHLLEYSAGKLRGEAAVKIETHMRGCADCAEVGKSQAAVWGLLDSWEPRAVSPDFNRRLYARIDAAASASWFERMSSAVGDFFRPAFVRPAFSLAAATIVIAAGFVLDHPGKMTTNVSSLDEIHVSSLQTGSYAAVDASGLQVDQVESTLDDIEMLRQFDAKSDDNGKESSSKSM